MNNVHSLQERRAIKQNHRETCNLRMDEACDWVTKIDRDLSRREKKALQQWLVKDKENLKNFLEVAKVWDKSNELNRLADIFPKQTLSPKTMSKFSKAMAASIIFVLSLSLFQASDYFSVEKQQTDIVKMDTNRTLKTLIGESHTFNLSDGSKIVLNTDTIAKVNFSPELRFIDLKQGEIHIDVAHDKSRPLQVKVGDKIVQAVGTAFNIEVKDQLAELIVTDGTVIVKDALSKDPTEQLEKETHSTNQSEKTLALNSSSLMTSSLNPGSLKTKPLMTVTKGEKVNLEKKGQIKHHVIKVKPIEIVASLSWRQGNIIFRGESLQDAMDEISRYNDIQIHLANDQNLKNIKIAGMFRTGDIDGLLSMLKANFNIDSEKKANKNIYLRLSSPS